MNSRCCWVLLLVLTVYSVGAIQKKFYIGGLFPTNIADPQDRASLGLYPQLAAQLAILHVRESGLLAGHNVSLELKSFETGCDKAEAVYAYLQLMKALQIRARSAEGLEIAAADPAYVVLGPACNQPTYFTATLTSRYLKDIQVSYSASTSLLSDIETLPYFYRTVPSYSLYAETIYAVMQVFDWLFLGVVHQEVADYTRSLEDLNALLTRHNDDGASIIDSPNLNGFLSNSVAISTSARIFVAMVPEFKAATTLCTAFKTGLTGENYQWILLGDFREGWWMNANISLRNSLKCTNEEMLKATESVLILTHLPLISSSKLSSELDKDFWLEFSSFVETRTGKEFEGEQASRVAPAYDAVWVIAHALNRALNDSKSPDSANENRQHLSEMAKIGGRPVTSFTKVLNTALERTDYAGHLSRIKFNSSTHTVEDPMTYLLQMQSGHMIPIGVHSRAGGLNLTFYGNELKWKGSSPPRDRPVSKLQSVDLWIVIIAVTIAVVGVACAITIIIVNFVYRKHKVIKASSPYINLVIACGCVFGFASIPFMSTEHLKLILNIMPTSFPYLCNIRLWLLTIGFTLAFGALFAKTWRIYAVFRNPWNKKRPYKDHVLLIMVAVFLFLDLVILILWAIIDPLKLVKVVSTDREAFLQREYYYCVSEYTPGSNISFLAWIGIIVIPKAILLAFGIFLVIQTSKIKAKFFRDARYTGIAIFGFVMVCGIGVPVSFFSMFFFQEHLGYVMSTGTILICSFLILIMVFVPKFVLLRRYKKKVPSAVLLGLNLSFRVHQRRLTQSTQRVSGERKAYYARMIESETVHINRSSHDSSRSPSSSSEDDSISLSDVQNDWGLQPCNSATTIGWEDAFDSDSDSGSVYSIQEKKLKFGELEYIASVLVCGEHTRRISTDTVMTTVGSDESVWFRSRTISCDGSHNRRGVRRKSTCNTIFEDSVLEDSYESDPKVMETSYQHYTSRTGLTRTNSV